MKQTERETILNVKNLRVTYEQKSQSTHVLNDLSFDLKKGDVVALIGESGSGKSTVAKTLTGLLPPSAMVQNGTLEIGSFYTDLTNEKIAWQGIRGKEIALMFQDAQQALNPLLTIEQHFKEVLLFHKIASVEEVVPLTTKLLNRLNFTDVSKILDSYPFQLSGGMCQRICLALAVCLKPKVLIADEPTSALDLLSQKEVLLLLKTMKKEYDLTVLLITHDLDVAKTISNRIIVLHQGVIEEKGSTKAVFSRAKAHYTKELLMARSLIARPRSVDKRWNSNEPILEIIDLEKSFNSKSKVLRGLNLTLHKKEIVGVLGQSGCGKSTLAKCITGLELPSGGQILYRNVDISRIKGNQKRQMCQHIQLVFQDARASLNPRRSALQLVQEPLHYLQIGHKKERESLAKLYLQEVGICEETQKRRPPQLSTGQCQRIAVARALVLKPDILICDEAVSALDMKIQSQILVLLQRLQKQFGFSVIMISHDLKVLKFICDRIAIMKEGSI
ncbi:ABC transporter ATP-binding protein [Bacillus alkalicellulosilyticus]|uniref:ABC transporter ATP-binding protein n=1 Tax=Alkalihalobacterium alkalicellulosilyticum TaxID=1912214 RepID=UPI000996674E|nr:ABC transporter ATP-binding protein [Bacillus alkalicellulosilyticus]